LFGLIGCMLATRQPDRSRIGESPFAKGKEGRALAVATREFTLQDSGGAARLIRPVRIESTHASRTMIPVARWTMTSNLPFNRTSPKLFSVEFAGDWRTIRCPKASFPCQPVF
jgi:hypothetical protein